jgi:hypothetical protein
VSSPMSARLSALVRRVFWVAPLLAAAASASCSYEPTSGSTIPSPLVAQVAGTWTGPVTLSTLSDPNAVSAPLAGTLQCVGDALKASLGETDTATLILSQAGVDLSGRLTMERSGLSCSYTGTATPGAFVLSTPNVEAEKINTCDAPRIVVRCASGEVFDVVPIGTTITASVSDGAATGTLAQTYSVFITDTTTGRGGLTTRSSVSMAVRR